MELLGGIALVLWGAMAGVWIATWIMRRDDRRRGK